jgi:hypothetical protein
MNTQININQTKAPLLVKQRQEVVLKTPLLTRRSRSRGWLLNPIKAWLLTLLLLLTTTIAAQAQTQILWQKCYGTGQNTEGLWSPIRTKDGNIVCIKYTSGMNVVMKIDNNTGNVLWTKNIVANTGVAQIIELPDGSLVGAGSTSNPAVPNNVGTVSAVYVIKMDSAGNTLWHNAIATTYSDRGEGVAYLDGRLLVSGDMIMDDWTMYYNYVAIIEFNPITGAFIKQNIIREWTGVGYAPKKIMKSSVPNHYYMTSAGSLQRIDTSLVPATLTWCSYSNNITIRDFLYNADSTAFMTVGYVSDTICPLINSRGRASVSRVDTGVNVIQAAGCVSADYADFTVMMQADDGNYYGVGEMRPPESAWKHDYWLVKFTPQATIMWEQNFGGTGNELIAGMCKGNNPGEILLIGMSNSNDGHVSGNHGGDDGWIIKLKDNTMVSTTDGKNTPNTLTVTPIKNNEYQVSLTGENIKYPTTLTLTDALGRQLRTIKMDANTTTIDLSSYAQGVYLLAAQGYKSVKLVR